MAPQASDTIAVWRMDHAVQRLRCLSDSNRARTRKTLSAMATSLAASAQMGYRGYPPSYTVCIRRHGLQSKHGVGFARSKVRSAAVCIDSRVYWRFFWFVCVHACTHPWCRPALIAFPGALHFIVLHFLRPLPPSVLQDCSVSSVTPAAAQRSFRHSVSFRRNSREPADTAGLLSLSPFIPEEITTEGDSTVCAQFLRPLSQQPVAP